MESTRVQVGQGDQSLVKCFAANRDYVGAVIGVIKAGVQYDHSPRCQHAQHLDECNRASSLNGAS